MSLGPRQNNVEAKNSEDEKKSLNYVSPRGCETFFSLLGLGGVRPESKSFWESIMILKIFVNIYKTYLECCGFEMYPKIFESILQFLTVVSESICKYLTVFAST